MMIGDIPQISNSTYTNNSYAGTSTGMGLVSAGTSTGTRLMQFPTGTSTTTSTATLINLMNATYDREDDDMADVSNRVVRVVIVDTNENLPIESRLLYKGDEQFTDLTDQELFFELDIKNILGKHNEVRIKTVDKKKSSGEKQVYLEPAKVRDLKMVVVEIAKF